MCSRECVRVSVAAAPRLTGGVFASVVFHAGLIALLVFYLRQPPLPTPPLYQVKIFAAPPGERAIGTVQSEPTPTAPPKPTPTPAPATKAPAPPKTKSTTPPVTKPKPTPKAKATPTKSTPVDAPGTKPTPASSTPAPKAGGGEQGGKGADVANLDTPGIEFNYPYYTNNIVRQLLLQFGASSSRFSAEVRFVIRRDGSVDPSSIKIVTSSGNYSFDSRVLGAVEAAANAKAFGVLPPGFQEDILPVNFRFSPQIR